jgi:hypothetical protein
MSKPKQPARMKGGKLAAVTIGVDDPPPPTLIFPYYQYPGRHTHNIYYKLTAQPDDDAVNYEPMIPHVLELNRPAPS